MYRLLIADDEEIERKALKMMLESDIPDLCVQADVANGVELLQRIRGAQYDIILVDVEMPGLSGLDTIKMAAEQLGQTKVIVCTAYSKFDYAQMAVECHVDNYVLKPVKRERILGVVKSAIRDIEKERAEALHSEQLRDAIREIRPMIEEEVMNHLCFGNGSPDKLLMYQNLLELSGLSGAVTAFLVTGAKHAGPLPADPLGQLIAVRQTIDDLKQTIRAITGDILMRADRNELVCLLPFSNGKQEYQCRVQAIQLVEVILQKFEAHKGVNVTVGIGSFCENPQEMHLSYRESMSALYDTKTSLPIRHYNDLFGRKPKAPLSPDERKRLTDAMISGDKQSLTDVIDKLFQSLQDREMAELTNCVTELLLECNHVLGAYALRGQDAAFDVGQLWGEYHSMASPAEVEAWLTDVCTRMSWTIGARCESSRNSIIENALKFIDAHYSSDISLEDVARECNVSIYYLSRLFKEQMGENYTAYLTKVRMEAAKMLIRKGGDPTKAVASKTGFNNPAYFCKVFKAYTGYTVNEYRSTF